MIHMKAPKHQRNGFIILNEEGARGSARASRSLYRRASRVPFAYPFLQNARHAGGIVTGPKQEIAPCWLRLPERQTTRDSHDPRKLGESDLQLIQPGSAWRLPT